MLHRAIKSNLVSLHYVKKLLIYRFGICSNLLKLVRFWRWVRLIRLWIFYRSKLLLVLRIHSGKENCSSRMRLAWSSWLNCFYSVHFPKKVIKQPASPFISPWWIGVTNMYVALVYFYLRRYDERSSHPSCCIFVPFLGRFEVTSSTKMFNNNNFHNSLNSRRTDGGKNTNKQCIF